MIILIEELKTFIAVVDKKSFTKAASIINISQPSVSLHIKILEKKFNTKLIERSNKQRNILITQTGEILYKKAKQIISLIDDTKDELTIIMIPPLFLKDWRKHDHRRIFTSLNTRRIY